MKTVKLKMLTDLKKLRKQLTKTLVDGDDGYVEEWNPSDSMIEMFGSMMCPPQLKTVIQDIQ